MATRWLAIKSGCYTLPWNEVSDRRSALLEDTTGHWGLLRVWGRGRAQEEEEQREVHRQVQRKVEATKVLVESMTNGGSPFDSRNCLLVTLNGSSWGDHDRSPIAALREPQTRISHRSWDRDPECDSTSSFLWGNRSLGAWDTVMIRFSFQTWDQIGTS